MINNYSNSKTPTPNKEWVAKSEIVRLEEINTQLKKDKAFDIFLAINAQDSGQVVISINKAIPANERGLMLLELEKKLKLSIDESITIWCEPVGDRSTLRNLRGVKISI
jgi:hypothetical protein